MPRDLALRFARCTTSTARGAIALAGLGALVGIGACESSLGDHQAPSGCDVADQLRCANGEICEEVEGGDPACFPPVLLVGDVHDASSQAPIADARIIAVDETGLAISRAGHTTSDGSFHLQVPVKRDATGAPLTRVFKLRIEAEDYLPFPRAPLETPSFDAKAALGPPYELVDPKASIALIHLTNTSGNGTVKGTVVSDDPRGTLVVIGGATGMADLDGAFVVSNVKPGNLKVLAFKQGANFDVGTTILNASATVAVDVTANEEPTSVVTGKITGTSTPTSVILVQEDTFDPVTVRGEYPPGLRVDGVSTEFSVSGVPNGKYVVLPGFFDDGLVRNPFDTAEGVPLAKITVSGKPVALDTPLSVVDALGVVSPGANAIDTVAGTPKLIWEGDPSADAYHVQVFTMLGALVWEQTGQFTQAGPNGTVDYAGDPLDHGGLYQFRVTSLVAGQPRRATEDLKGLFTYQ